MEPSADSLRSSFHTCARDPDAVLSEEAVSFDLDVSCANPEVVGPRADGSGATRIWVDLVLEVVGPDGSDQARLNHLTFEDPGGGDSGSVQLMVRKCDSDCAAVAGTRQTFVPFVGDAEPGVWVFQLPPGRYIARVSRDANSPGRVRFRWG